MSDFKFLSIFFGIIIMILATGRLIKHDQDQVYKSCKPICGDYAIVFNRSDVHSCVCSQHYKVFDLEVK